MSNLVNQVKAPLGLTGIVMVQSVAGSGTRCKRVWYKVWQGLVQGVTGFLVQGVAGSGTRCDRVWYKV